MSTIIQDVVRGALKLVGLPERETFRSWRDFLERLPELYSVEIPAGVAGIVISHTEPGEDDRDKLWLRRNTSGSFLGLYVFANGVWSQFINQKPNQIVFEFGDSANISSGYILIEEGDGIIDADVVNTIKAQYVPNGAGGFKYFATRKL